MRFNPEVETFRLEDVNRRISQDAPAFIDEAERGYAAQIDGAIREILARGAHLIFLSGPSASGKTTTARLLRRKLGALGNNAIYVSLDNFYKNRDDSPLWEDGQKNFESVESLDLEHFQRSIHTLLSSGAAQFPLYDFHSGNRSDKSMPLSWDEHTYIIFEGIQALHPDLAAQAPKGEGLRIYISVHSSLIGDDDQVLLSPRDIRLMRRLLRDRVTRNSPPGFTLKLWDKVLLGEERYMWPYRQQADIHMNTIHEYEVALYGEKMLPIIYGGEFTGESEPLGRHLAASLRQIEPLGWDAVPGGSLLEEFIIRG
ncbi:MAG: hypothetical protein ACOX88_06050 [Christensenellales bacterium]|jgi:uridine kinase